jgi:hypothetical protein
MYEEDNVKELIGKTVIEIDNSDGEELTFTCSDGTIYRMFHAQDCCENVRIEDIIGDLNDLLNTPMIEAREDTNSDEPPVERYGDSHTWTFYNFATIKGYVTIRWFGSSNGYYSERVSFVRVED